MSCDRHGRCGVITGLAITGHLLWSKDVTDQRGQALISRDMPHAITTGYALRSQDMRPIHDHTVRAHMWLRFDLR